MASGFVSGPEVEDESGEVSVEPARVGSVRRRAREEGLKQEGNEPLEGCGDALDDVAFAGGDYVVGSRGTDGVGAGKDDRAGDGEDNDRELQDGVTAEMTSVGAVEGIRRAGREE